MQLPSGWIPVSRVLAAKLEAELHRELPRAHQLRSWQLRAIARREDRDDVLFLGPEEQGPVFWVHLTWSIETDPQWPWTETYTNLEDFVERWPREELADELDEGDG